MQRPTWATVVGILAIIFGGFGIMGGAQEIVMPHMLDMQKELVLNINEMLQQNQLNKPNAKTPSEENIKQGLNPLKLLDYFSDKMELPAWFRTLAPLFGTISILISISYLLSGVFILMLKPFAPLVFNITLGISIGWGIISAIIYGLSGNIILVLNVPGSITSVIIDVVLIVIVIMGNQQAFRSQKA